MEELDYKIVEPTTAFGKFCRFFLTSFGWKLHNKIPITKKYVIIQAPHTSNWDFFWGKLWNFVTGFYPKVLIKKELFFWPLGGILRALGGEPLDRKNRKVSVTDILVEEFAKRDEFILAITPEGTRSKNPNWKTGFYHIAVRANVPISLGFIDYKNKELGTSEIFYPTGDFKADFRKIREFYKDMGGKNPDQFSVGDDIV